MTVLARLWLRLASLLMVRGPHASTLFLVIPSKGAGGESLDVLAIDPRSAAIGNQFAEIRAISAKILDVDGDKQDDLVLEFPAMATRDLAAVSSATQEPLGCRYETHDRTGYLVADIFSLGRPIPLPRAGSSRQRQLLSKGAPSSPLVPEKTALIDIYVYDDDPTGLWAVNSNGLTGLSTYVGPGMATGPNYFV